MKNAFDLHFHPLAKKFLEEYDKDKRRNLRTYGDRNDLTGLGKLVNKLAGRILNSQACVDYCIDAGLHLGVAGLVAIERVFASKKGMLKLLEAEVFGKNIVAPLDVEHFEYVRSPGSFYDKMFRDELDFYLWAHEQKNKVNILSRKGAKSRLKMQANKLNLLLAIEGGHTICRHNLQQRASITEITDRIKEVRESDEADFLYLTLTHLSHIPEQSLCSHAFGFKLVNGISASYPQINGLTPAGEAAVRACMDTNINDYPILVDTKHMSLKGRQDFYAYRKKLMEDSTFKTPDKGWPILATHMGVTGYRLEDMPLLMKEKGREAGIEQCVRVKLDRIRAGKIRGTIGDHVYFNPSSIGLCDDDIEEIAASNGLIGISLDARILGYEGFKKRFQDEYDYLSLNDFAALFPEEARQLPFLLPLLEPQTEPVEESMIGQEVFAGRQKREVYCFCMNVLHTIAIINQMPAGERHNKNGWDFICMGSDYDGLIDSIAMADSVPNLPKFRRKVARYFKDAAKAYRKQFEYDGDLFPQKNKKDDIEALIDKFFYDNGRDFVKNWWGVA